jgi:hypothetical protein
VRSNRLDALWQRTLGRSLSSLVSGLPMLLLTPRGRTKFPSVAGKTVEPAWTKST